MVPHSFEGSRADLARLKDMTSGFIGRFVLAVERATRAECGGGALTRHAADLVVPDETRAEVAVLKSVAAHFVMRAAERLDVLARQREVVAELVSAFAERPEERLDADLLADWRAAGDDAARLRVVVDQVASLTDTRAILLHSQWA
jgi:dGTPase